jgi:hypothetical protein
MTAMSIQNYKNLLGRWTGSNQLFFEGESYASESALSVAAAMQGQFILTTYDWALEGEPQDGLIIFASRTNTSPVRSLWMDSWHMRNDVMQCAGTRDEKGMLSLRGSYPAPEGPDWGWRIEIDPKGPDELEVRMFNLTPSGAEQLAVHGQYRRIMR